MSQYRNASEAEALAEEVVIPVYKPFLENRNIDYVLNSKPMKSKGVDVWAKIKKASPLEKYQTDFDIILFVNERIWNNLTREQRIALLHHEFCHVDENDDGELVMLTHDLEEFAEVVKHHGLWRPGVEHFASQLTLNLNKGVSKPRPWFDPHVTGTVKSDVEDQPASFAIDDIDESGNETKVSITANGRTVEMTGEQFDEAVKSVESVEAAGRTFVAALDKRDAADEDLPGVDVDEAESPSEAVH